MDFILNGEIDLIIQLGIALFLGITLGTERSVAHRSAGMRTYGLVSLGACLFVIISELITSKYFGAVGFDPLRMASSIVTGIGFIGAGVIIFRNRHLSGLTSAAGLWVAAGIGTAVGFKLYLLAITAAILTIITFSLLWPLEVKIKELSSDNPDDVE